MFLFQDHGCNLHTLATDRHPSIQKIMRETYPDIRHEYDLWHIVKGLKKKLLATKDPELMHWIRAISNHLWYCAATCDGDTTKLKETWTGMLHHVTNEHTWISGEMVTSCEHGPYTPEESQTRPWINTDSKAFQVLQKHVLDKRLLKDLNKVIYYVNSHNINICKKVTF